MAALVASSWISDRPSKPTVREPQVKFRTIGRAFDPGFMGIWLPEERKRGPRVRAVVEENRGALHAGTAAQEVVDT